MKVKTGADAPPTTRHILDSWFAGQKEEAEKVLGSPKAYSEKYKKEHETLTFARLADEIRLLNRQGHSFLNDPSAHVTNNIEGFVSVLKSREYNSVQPLGEEARAFVAESDVIKFGQLATGINEYLRARADIFGASDAPIPEKVLEDIITASEVPLPKGNVTVSTMMGDQLSLFVEARKKSQSSKSSPSKGKSSDSPLQENKHVSQQKMAIVALAESVSIPANDIGFMAAVAALTEFGVTPQEAEKLEEWLTKKKYNLFQKTEPTSLVAFVALYTQQVGLRADPAVIKDSVLGRIIEIRPTAAKPRQGTGPGSPGNDHKQALGYLGDKDGTYIRPPESNEKHKHLENHPETSLQALARKEEKLSSWLKGPEGRGTKEGPNDNSVVGAVLNDLGELFRVKDTIHPKALSERNSPDEIAKLDKKINEALPQLTPPQGLDEICQPVWRLKKLEKQIASDIKTKMAEEIADGDTAKLTQRSNDVHELLAQGMRVQERIAQEMQPVVKQISQEMYDHDQVRAWLQKKQSGSQINGTDLIALRHLFTEAIPPYYAQNKVSAEALAAAKEIRRTAVSFWAEDRTVSLSQFKKIRPRKKAPTSGWSAVANQPGSRADVRAAVMRILEEDCRISFPEGFDPKNYPEDHPFLNADLDDHVSSLEFLQLASTLEYEYGVKIRTMEQGKAYLRNINTIVDTLAPKRQPQPAQTENKAAPPPTGSPIRRPWS